MADVAAAVRRNDRGGIGATRPEINAGTQAEVMARFLPLLGESGHVVWATAWSERKGVWTPQAFWASSTPSGMVLPPTAVAPDNEELRRRAAAEHQSIYDPKSGNFALPIAGIVIVGRVDPGPAPAVWHDLETPLLVALEQALWRERWGHLARWSADVIKARSEEDWMAAWRQGTRLLEGVEAQALRNYQGDIIYPDPSRQVRLPETPMRLSVGPGYSWLLDLDAQHWAMDMAKAMANHLATAAYAVTEWHNLRDAATTDKLTGLLNREGFGIFIDQDFGAGVQGVFVLMDLNHFKDLNDSKGHPEGDRALRDIAEAWRRIIRPTDKIARLGGDEFAAWVPRLPISEAVAWVERQVRAFPLAEFGLSVSVGCAATMPGDAFDDVYRLADAALYAAKEEAHEAARLDPDHLAPNVVRAQRR